MKCPQTMDKLLLNIFVDSIYLQINTVLKSNGVGRRAFIGWPLARMELFLLLCRLMQTFAFTVPEGQQRPSGSMVGDSIVPGPPSYMLKLEIRA